MTRSMDDFDATGIDPFIDAYEAAQARDGHARLADYLPDADHPLYLSVLCELVRVDLEYGWMRGAPRALDDYRAEYPSLFRDPERAREVAFEESRLRRQAEEELARRGFSPVRRLEDAAPLDRRYRHGTHDGLAEALASSAGPSAHSALLFGLHESSPETARRLADALASLPEPGTEFGGFRLLRELGRGAFGRVYLARQEGLADRLVALKVSAELPGETQALAQLQHAHIVPIYSVHHVGGLRAVCMPYLGTTTLADLLCALRSRGDLMTPGDSASTDLEALRGPAHVRAVLTIGAGLADGLAHAHARGIVHRDLKPANVLLTEDGQPILLDFNLAADTKAPFQAATAMIGGTLPYMAPEQLESLRDDRRPGTADPRGDLFALGLILHELLTGKNPFPVRTGPLEEVVALMAEDRRGPPPTTRRQNPDVSPAVDAIVARCLEPDPDRRYQEAGELLADLQRQLEDRPLLHAPDRSPRERLAKWARRHPRLSSATTLGLIAASLLGMLASGYAQRQRRFGPIEAAHALWQLAEEHEEAAVLALDPALREQGTAVCRRALARYGVVESPSWRRSPLFANLPEAGQAEVESRMGELLLLWAHGLAVEAAGTGTDAPGRSALFREALRRNELAESCFTGGHAPRALWVQRARLARLGGDADEAYRAEARARSTPLRSPRDYALQVLEEPDAPPSPEIIAALGEASRRNPRDFPLWMVLGHIAALGGRLQEADDCYSVATVLRPGSPWPYLHRGRLALERSDHAAARLDLDEALRLRPGLTAALVNRAIARLGQRDPAGAVADLTEALDRGADGPRIYLIRTRARASAGDTDGAERDRAQGLRTTPRDVDDWIARGLARLPGDPANALADLDRALALEPRSRAALQNRAVVLSEHLGRTEEAIEALDLLVRLYPDAVPARVGRGVLLARLGRVSAAQRDAEESRRRDPSSPATTYRVACIYALTSRTEPADRARAFHLLAEAFDDANGGDWVEVARSDPDLAPLRGQAALTRLLQRQVGRGLTPGPGPGPARPAQRSRGFPAKGRTVSSSEVSFH